MSTGVLPESQSQAETKSHPQPRGSQHRTQPQDSRRGRWWKRGLLTIVAIAVVAIAARLIPVATSARKSGPKLTHTITRGDLVVTVTEQGTLESSNNTEIKCKVRGYSTVIWVIKGGTEVKPGDELVRLDTLEFEDRVSEVSKWAHVTRAEAERSKADVARAELAVQEYLEGRYRSQLMTLEKDLAIAESNLRTAQNMLGHAQDMAARGYVGKLEVEEKTFAVTQAKLSVEVRQTAIDVLKRFSNAMELETLNGNLKAARASHEADKERAKQLAEQLVLCVADLKYCVVKAERSGLVIYPTTVPWKYAPEIDKGATVYMGQTLLLMPDLSKMQVKVGIPESVVHRIKPGLDARVTLQDETLDGQVSSVASVTAPTSQWTGNIVTYDTIIKLPSLKRLKPGMSAEVEVIIARHEDVLTIPVAAVVETAEGDFCWVKTADGAQRRSLALGDTNNMFTVVKEGLKEGDQVMLNPLACMDEAQKEALKPLDEAKQPKPESPESGNKAKPPEPSSGKQAGGSNKPEEPKPKAG